MSEFQASVSTIIEVSLTKKQVNDAVLDYINKKGKNLLFLPEQNITSVNHISKKGKEIFTVQINEELNVQDDVIISNI